VAQAKIKADLVEAARAFMAGDDFKREVIITMPASVMYSFESAMEEVLVSTEGLSTFKLQWGACYRKYAKACAKYNLGLAWAIALESAENFVARENEAGNDGQNLFDQRYRKEFAAHYEETQKIRRTSLFSVLAPKEAAELVKLAAKLDTVIPTVKSHKVAKPGSASKRGLGKGVTPKGGGKKRGVKGSRHNKKR